MTLFIRPEWLALLLLLPLLAWPLRRSLARQTPLQRRVCLGVRALILALLVLALAGPRLPWRSKEVAVAFVVDRSASITPEAAAQAQAKVIEMLAHRRGGDVALTIGYAGEAALLPQAVEEWPAQPLPDATDTGGALAFASALLPEGKTRRVVLLSDGYDTGGRATAAARALAAGGIELLAYPLENPPRPEVLIERLEIPAELREGEAFDATLHLRSNVATASGVRLYLNGFLVGEERLSLEPGERATTFRNLRPPKESAYYEAEITPDKDTLPENNRARAAHLARGEPRILIVDPEPERLAPLRKALEAGHIAATVRPPNGLPRTMEELQRWDALVLSDVPAPLLTRAQMQLFTRWVRDFGGGFAMLGGEQSFGVGGYYRTPLETMLPVENEHDDRNEFPTVAVMIVLDSSGSMAAQVAGQTKMSLAAQGAALALQVLQPKDLLGVTAVDSRVHNVIPLARHPDKAEVGQRILRVNAGGGGIYVYTAMLDAAARLREVNAKIKHVILFSDAADAEEKKAGEMADGSTLPGTALDLAASMASAQMTTSVVALGSASDRDVAFLRQLAEAGQGRFYLTGDALSLPQIFTSETMRVAQSSLVEEPVAASLVRRSPVVEGIDWKEAPLLLGYNRTKLKPTADLLLASETGDPLLAQWRYGLGRVAAFTSDAKSRWAAEWLGWPGYGKFWAQLMRGLLPRSGEEGAGGLHVAQSVEGGRLRLRIDAVEADGAFRNQLPLTVTAVGSDGVPQSVEARQSAPGEYEAEVALSGTGTTWVHLASPQLPEQGRSLTHTVAYPAEFLHNDTDAAALRALAEGGQFAPPPDAAFARPVRGVPSPADLSPVLIMLALLLLPVDVWLRRRTW